jgi:hypothetical protein
MAVLTTALDTDFTPAVGDFLVQCTGGSVQLMRKNNSGAALASCSILTNEAKTVSNPVTGAVYRFAKVHPNTTPVVSADQ